jgi:hypothetical protein
MWKVQNETQVYIFDCVTLKKPQISSEDVHTSRKALNNEWFQQTN